MINKKELAILKKENILEYVVKHGEWRFKRGRNLSAILPLPYGESNPRKAYVLAQKKLADFNRPRPRRRRSIFNIQGQTQLEAFLGIPNPNESPWPGATKVPHTNSQWY